MRRICKYILVFTVALAARISWVIYTGIHTGVDTSNFMASCEFWLHNPAGIVGIDLIAGLEYAGATIPMCWLIDGLGLGTLGFVAYQILISALGTVLFADACRREFGSPWGIFGGLVLAIHWPTFKWVSWILTDATFIAALVAGIWVVVWVRTSSQVRIYHRGAVAVAAIVIAFTRPVGLLIAVIWLCWFAVYAQNWWDLEIRIPEVAGAIATVWAYVSLSSRGEFSTQLLDVWQQGVIVLDSGLLRQSYEATSADSVLGFLIAHPIHVLFMGLLKVAVFFLPVVPRFSVIHNLLNVLLLVPVMVGAFLGAVVLVRRYDRGMMMTWLVPALAMLALIAATFVDWDWRYRSPFGPLFIGLTIAAVSSYVDVDRIRG
ncbi:hypothetical protein I7X12_12085 [Halosimplex litoreum]|uniref:Dolichyl-phosphate-mannose-protein mannosyltransferase n=1 Tax=Halosimplex litoreum TaxID=1198301 RepID=A0A7T3FVL8_9EURY|nr:hypothetical protein [Halosimplex litoreum]QPV61505.1 hypothetical protein I7X12_12085 [Halosimplex litoreum]